MTDTPPPRPNDRQPCPSRGCRTWHLAHGLPHRCGIDPPDPARAVDTKEAA